MWIAITWEIFGKYEIVPIIPDLPGIVDGNNLQIRQFCPLRSTDGIGKRVRGDALEQIADGLNLTVATIASYRYAILKKLKVKSDVELIRLAVKLGLLHKKID